MNSHDFAAISEVAQLQSFSPHILEASLSCCNWDDIFADFYRTNCPRFAGFRALCEGSREFDLHMQIVHNDFLTSIDVLVRNCLIDMGVSEEQCAAAATQRIRNGDRVATSLLQRLRRYADFFEFGKMMEQQFIAQHAASAASQHTASAPVHVRVLWDVENIPATSSSGIDGFETVQRLHHFLSRLGLHGSGVHTRITAFFSPVSSHVSKRTTQQLDKAGVELVWVSGKREDADRKLSHRISQEMQVLPPNLCSCFVLISSDTDFRHHLSLLHSSGYRVIVLHRADKGLWEQTMSLHATESYHWHEVMGITTNDIKQQQHQQENRTSIKHTKKHSKDNAVTATNQEQTKCRTERKQKHTNADCSSKWYAGRCTRWLHRYGFVAVDIDTAEAPASVFVHISALSEECNGELDVGAKVIVQIGSNEKGTCITALKLAQQLLEK